MKLDSQDDEGGVLGYNILDSTEQDQTNYLSKKIKAINSNF
jgi:hypothetical protein